MKESSPLGFRRFARKKDLLEWEGSARVMDLAPDFRSQKEIFLESPFTGDSDHLWHSAQQNRFMNLGSTWNMHLWVFVPLSQRSG